MKINKNKFKLLAVLALVWFVLSIYISISRYTILGGTNLVRTFNGDLNGLSQFTSGDVDRLKSILSSSIILGEMGNFVTYSYLGLAVLISVLMSFDIVIRDYKKTHMSHLMLANLPVKIYRIKLAKILAGWSIYLFCILIFSIATICMDIFWRVYLGDYYASSIWSIFGDTSFMLTSSNSAILIAVLLILPSIIGLQSLVGLLFTSDSRGRVGKKILCLFLLLICGGVVVFIMMTYMFSETMVYSYRKEMVLVLCSIGVYIVSTCVFYLDCKYTSNRIRGGVSNG